MRFYYNDEIDSDADGVFEAETPEIAIDLAIQWRKDMRPHHKTVNGDLSMMEKSTGKIIVIFVFGRGHYSRANNDTPTHGYYDVT